ncbi:ABC transporter permease [Silvibacterium dinghuense]|uniref:ABC transporter permease n=1 Tax=Silvibacterium dinghuense TaxID=1560006 RepID=A0A4Q1SDG0_9BACT|nr:ABC transporter permease [Silvibacterium dinghuense]RXS95266.1 ABC transporter permease [Silvibacterium dinghuense]
MILDICLAARRLWASPRYSIGVILMLALGIGSATAVFSVVEGVLLHRLPFPDSDRLVVLTDVLQGPGITGNGEEGVTGPDILHYIHQTHSFDGLGGYLSLSLELSGAGEPAIVRGARMSSGVFTALGVHPLLGRWYTQAEDERQERLAVLSYGTWKARFQADPAVLGKTVQLNRRPYVVIGVMPRGFDFPLVLGHEEHSELWVPMSLTQDELTTEAADWQFYMVGRLKAGVSRAVAAEDAAVVSAETVREHAAAIAGYTVHPVVRGLLEETVEASQPLLKTLSAAVLVVLLIACANTAGWMLVRAIEQRREIAVRLALGARPGDLLRQAVVESLLLSLSGATLGMLAAAIADRVLVATLPETLPRLNGIHLNPQVVLLALGLAMATGIVCALAPTFAAVRVPVNATLSEGGRTASSGAVHGRLRSGLVVMEIAVALILLASAGLLLRSFARMRAVPLGFAPENVVVANYGLPGKVYDSQQKVDAFNRELVRRLELLPGVEAAGMTSILPASGVDQDSPYFAEGNAESLAGHDLATLVSVEGQYFRAMGIPLLRGRYLDARDNATGQLATVVSRGLAEQAWPGQDPIGRRIRLGITGTQWLTVVGEVADVKEGSPDGPRKVQFYETADQGLAALGSVGNPSLIYGSGGAIVLRARLAPQAAMPLLEQQVRALDPQLPLHRMHTMEAQVDQAEGERSFYTHTLSAFALAALLLSSAGVYGVIAFTAEQRVQEMAIRMALGAGQRNVLALVMASGARLAIWGCLLGVGGAILAARSLSSFLFEVSPVDPLVLALSVGVILLLAMAASLLPALRVAAIDPARVLRSQ